QQRYPGADQAGGARGDPPRLFRGGSGYRGNQHLLRQPHQPGRLRRRRAGARDQRGEREARASHRRRISGEGRRKRDLASPLRRGRDRPDQQDAVAVARRQRSRLSRDRLRLPERRVPRADRRAGRGRRGLRADRDGVRHAQCQGRDHGRDRGGRGAGPRPADH
ncbi:hypothetical protein LTR94_028058, partial [Friedmanniomyces endolithicus]